MFSNYGAKVRVEGPISRFLHNTAWIFSSLASDFGHDWLYIYKQHLQITSSSSSLSSHSSSYSPASRIFFPLLRTSPSRALSPDCYIPSTFQRGCYTHLGLLQLWKVLNRRKFEGMICTRTV